MIYVDLKTYQSYIQILKEELVPAMGCTEPIALAYGASKCRSLIDGDIVKVDAEISGNIIKNVKSVIVPNTGGLKGIEASIAAGIVAGKHDKLLEVIAKVSEEEKLAVREFLISTPIVVRPSTSKEQLDIKITIHTKQHQATVRIAGYHTNIVLLRVDDDILFENEYKEAAKTNLVDRSILNMKDIYEFATIVKEEDVQDILERQIQYNTAIANEGLTHSWGANIGSTLLKYYGDDITIKARAFAAAGSDARMSGCELPVIINSGSGNQGMTTSLPVIAYANHLQVPRKKLYEALCLSNLTTIHQKTGIGRLSAYCGAISAGCAAGCGIAYLLGGDYEAICHTLVNSLAIVSGIICDGAKPSCAAKISSAVSAGIFGYHMYLNHNEFKDGDGLVLKGVENTIQNFSRLGKEGMKETDLKIIEMMTKC